MLCGRRDNVRGASDEHRGNWTGRTRSSSSIGKRWASISMSGLTAMRGQTLVMLGRGEEARPFLDRILQLEERSGGRSPSRHSEFGVCRSRLGRGKRRTRSRTCRPSVLYRDEILATPICEFMPRPVVDFLISSPEDSPRRLKICPKLSALLDRERLAWKMSPVFWPTWQMPTDWMAILETALFHRR